MSATLCGRCFEDRVEKGVCSACGSVREENPGKALKIGTVLDGKFLVGSLLGEPGGFGIVYLCWDRHLQRRVVIKELFPDDLVARHRNATDVQVNHSRHQDAFNLQRRLFLDEARKLAQFDGVAAVARVIQYFSENDTAYFVMPYLPGESLAKRIARQGALHWEQALALLWPLAEGLAAVHKLGILHRDIKPENVLIDDRGQPVLIDFGNAIASGPAQSQATGFYGLSRHFAAPEQYSNQHDRMGPWTDVYALCALLYFCLCGRRPADALQRTADPSVLVPLNSLAPETPERLLAVIGQGLELREEHRPVSVEALLSVLSPLRPRAFQWFQALPTNDFGNRMRQMRLKIDAGISHPRQWNPWAGAFQWFWLYAFHLPGPASAFAAFVILLAGVGLWWQLLPFALGLGVLVGGVVSAAYGDLLQYRRLATIGASLPGNTAEERAHARQILAHEGLPDPWRMMAGLVVPLALVGVGWMLQLREDSVREQVTSAMALEGLREQVAAYGKANDRFPKSLSDLNYVFTPDSEVKNLYMADSVIYLTLAVPAVEGHKLRLHPFHDRLGGISWQCHALDLPPAFTPKQCKLVE